jgi:hypothetical protein
MNKEIINRVAASSLETIDLETFYPGEEIVIFDLKPHLHMGLILKEKEFREALQQTDWNVYNRKIVAVTCTADAVIPVWAYMLVAAQLEPFASEIIMGDEQQAVRQVMIRRIQSMDTAPYADQRVVVKGCGQKTIDESVYLEITRKLRPVVKSIMYGEACSTVPVYKKK